MKSIRMSIYALIVGLLILLAMMGRGIWTELRELSTAADENAQWTISQLDTEIAKFNSALLRQKSSSAPDLDSLRLRGNIMLSRFDLVTQGNAANVLSKSEEAVRLLEDLRAFADGTDAIISADPADFDLSRLQEITEQAQPKARRLALLGVSLGAESEAASRRDFAVQLRRTGLVALCVIAALSAALIALNRLLIIAKDRDIALRFSEARLSATVSASLDPIITTDAARGIFSFNAAAEQVLGWRRDEVIGHNLAEVILGDDSTLDDLERAAKSDRRTEIVARRKSGEEFPAEISITSSGDSDPEMTIVYLRDISQRKRDEAAMVLAKDQAIRSDRAKSKFLAFMSHEMRTPLNGILGVLDLLKTTQLDGRQERYVNVATFSSEALLHQVNDALDVTHIDTGSLALSPRPFRPSDVIEGVAASLEPLAREKGLRMSVEIPADMRGKFIGDGARVGQILTNLIGNAVKFTNKGEISVSASGSPRQSETRLVINVTDTGRGIPNSYLELVFDDHVVLSDAEGRLSRGDGLGLSIARKIARAMGGEITVSSTEGKGSTFTLNIPLVPVLEHGGVTKVDALAANVVDTASRGKKRVLIVEDNPINRSVLSDMLDGLGHEVAEAENGEKGIELAAKRAFDLIIMDISMPGMDGIQTTAEIRRSHGPNQHIPIYGLSAYADEENRSHAETVGMSGFFTKPIRLNRLRHMLQGTELDGAVAGLQEIELDDDLVAELLDALGAQETLSKANALFSEAQTVLGSLDETDPVSVRKRLHRLRGAASTFGLVALAQRLDEAIEDSRLDREVHLTAIVDTLERAQNRLLASIQSYSEIEAWAEDGGDLGAAKA